MRAFIKFNKGVLKMPVLWQIWLLALVTTNLVVPMFFPQRLEARVVLVTFLASVTLVTLLTARFGFTRIIGLGHILWVPMLAFLFTRLGDIPTSDALGIWIRTLFVLNGISLAIDAADAIRYISGDREETSPKCSQAMDSSWL
jgi:hypothetical protein